MARRVLLLFACLYVLSIGRGFYSSDGEVMFQTTAALVERYSLKLSADPGLPQIVAGQGGAFYSKYDPGLPLLAVPFYVTGDWIAGVNRAHRYGLAALSVLLLPALAGAGTLALLARWIGTPRRALPVVLAAGVASPLWVYARELFAEAVLAFALTAALLIAHEAAGRRSRRRLVLAGALFGVGVLTRAALAIYALPLAVVVVWPMAGTGPTSQPPTPSPFPSRAREGRRGGNTAPLPRDGVGQRQALLEGGADLLACGAGALPFVLILLAHNALRFGDALHFGYAGEGFTTLPVWGALGLLISLGHGALIYAPPLIVSAGLWPRFRREFPALGWAVALAWAVALLFYGAWWAWGGGWCWGPRFLVPLLPLSMLPLMMLPDRRAWRGAALIALAAGIAVQVPGVLADVTPHFAAVSAASGDPNWLPGDTPLAGAIARLAHGQTEPLAVFHLRDLGLPPTWVYGVPLLLGIGAAAGAWAIGRQVRVSRDE